MSFAMFTGIVAGVLSLIAYTPRAIDIIKNKSSSSNTWIIWTLSNLLIAISYFNLGARTTIWVPLAYFVGSAAITALTYRYSAEGWKPLHGWIRALALLCGISWIFTFYPLVSMSFNVFIYFASHLMIIRTRLRSKRKETWVVTWALYFAGATLNLLALTSLSPEISAYPIILFIMDGAVFSITLRKHFVSLRAKEDISI